MKKYKLFYLSSILFAFGGIVNAQMADLRLNHSGYASGADSFSGQSVMNIISLAQTVVGKLSVLFPSLALLGLFYFIVMFIWKGNNDATKRHEYVLGMGYAILALFVMVSVWGLVQFLGSFFGIGIGGVAPMTDIPIPVR